MLNFKLKFNIQDLTPTFYFTVIKFSGLGPGQMLAHFPGRRQ